MESPSFPVCHQSHCLKSNSVVFQKKCTVVFQQDLALIHLICFNKAYGIMLIHFMGVPLTERPEFLELITKSDTT